MWSMLWQLYVSYIYELIFMASLLCEEHKKNIESVVWRFSLGQTYLSSFMHVLLVLAIASVLLTQMGWKFCSGLLIVWLNYCNFLRIYWSLKIAVLYFTSLIRKSNKCIYIIYLGTTIYFTSMYMMYIICWYNWLRPCVMFCMQSTNFCSIIQVYTFSKIICPMRAWCLINDCLL